MHRTEIGQTSALNDVPELTQAYDSSNVCLRDSLI